MEVAILFTRTVLSNCHCLAAGAICLAAATCTYYHLPKDTLHVGQVASFSQLCIHCVNILDKNSTVISQVHLEASKGSYFPPDQPEGVRKYLCGCLKLGMTIMSGEAIFQLQRHFKIHFSTNISYKVPKTYVFFLVPLCRCYELRITSSQPVSIDLTRNVKIHVGVPIL